MDFLDYREKLGVGFNDDSKFSYFITKLFNILEGVNYNSSLGYLDSEEYFCFCNLTGTQFKRDIMTSYYAVDRMGHCMDVLRSHTSSLTDFLPYYIALVNSVSVDKNKIMKRKSYADVATKMMDQSHITYELIEENGEYFIFPKGAKELDAALVSEPLEWLKDYPAAHRTYVTALKQYADGIYIRDTADNLRKALEAFLQEFLGNVKNLETNKNEICRYLGEQNVDAGIRGLFQPLINSYKNVNDRIAKHNDAVDKKYLEFLLYQTGVLIRLVLTVKHAETDDVSKTN